MERYALADGHSSIEVERYRFRGIGIRSVLKGSPMLHFCRATIACMAMLAATVGGAVAQQKPIAYPAKGQTAEQQSKDDAECNGWAKQTTGIDPVAVASTPAQAQPTQGGQRARGAARGAAGGAAIGAIAGDAGEGAAIGAVAGTMAGGRRARQDQAAAQNQAQAQQNQVMATYYRAVAACMQGKGYTIQ